MDHDFCKECYLQLRQETRHTIQWQRVEVRRGDLGYSVRERDGGHWYGIACCEWDARIRAVPKLYRLPKISHEAQATPTRPTHQL